MTLESKPSDITSNSITKSFGDRKKTADIAEKYSNKDTIPVGISNLWVYSDKIEFPCYRVSESSCSEVQTDPR